MNIQKWTQETWTQAMPEVPENVNNAISKALDIVRTKDDEAPAQTTHSYRTAPFRMGKRKAILAASLAVVVLGGTTFAAGQFWNDKALEQFQNPSVEIQQKAMESGVVSAPGCSVTAGGITVTAVQAVQDKNRVYILCKVETETPLIEASSCFGDCRIETEDDSHPFHWRMTFLDQKSGKWEKEGYWVIDGATVNKNWQGGSLNVTLKDFCYRSYKETSDGKLSAEEKTSTEHAVNGSWSFSIPLRDVSSLYKTVSVMQELKWGDAKYFIHSVTISPISLIIQYDVVTKGNSRAAHFTPGDIALIDKSGSSAEGFSLQKIMTQHPGEALVVVPPISTYYEEDGHRNAMVGLQQLVDIDQLAELVINCGEGMRIRLESE